MSEQAKATVLQTELQWQPTDITDLDPSELKPHPKNTEIYGDTEDASELEDTFVESVREKGVLEPLVVTEEKTIISGHRRWLAARRTGVESVPARVSSFESDLAEREAVIEFNRQREKTPGQIVNEFEEMLEIEQERAKKRQAEAGSKNLPNESTSSGNVSKTSDVGAARDKAAEKINANVSGRTLEKGLKVKQKAEEGDETAQKEWKKLQTGETTFNKASRKVSKEANRKKREEKRQDQKERVRESTLPTDAPRPKLKVADSVELPLDDESVDLIITSPPYNLGHENWRMGGEDRSERENGIGYSDEMPEQEYQEWQLDVFNELYRVADEGASFFYNHKLRQVRGEVIHPMDWIRSEDNPWTLRQEIVWDRTSTHNHSPTIFWPHDERIYWMTKGDPSIPEDGVGMSSIWEFHGPRPNTDHPAPFPDELPRRCIEAVGCDGDVILDPFGGSMTTCEVAAKLGYESIGVDIDEEYVEQARFRLGI